MGYMVPLSPHPFQNDIPKNDSRHQCGGGGKQAKQAVMEPSIEVLIRHDEADVDGREDYAEETAA